MGRTGHPYSGGQGGQGSDGGKGGLAWDLQMNCLGNKRGETLMKHAKNYKIKEFVISKSDRFGSGISIRIIGLFINSSFSFLPSYCVIINHLLVIMTTILTNYEYI